MLKAKYLIPAFAVVLVLLYVPGAPASAQRLQHKVGALLTSTGRGVGHLMQSVTS